MVHTDKVNYINSKEIFMSPLDSSPDSVLVSIRLIRKISFKKLIPFSLILKTYANLLS